MTEDKIDLHAWDDSLGTDYHDGPFDTVEEFRECLANLGDALNEPYGWDLGDDEYFCSETEDTKTGPVFSVFFVMPRKTATFSVSVLCPPGRESEIIQAVKDLMCPRIRTIWRPFL